MATLPNTQAPEPRITGNGDTLELNSIFHTIQGEGPYAGYAATFIRLAGCNLQCPLCDTEYTSRVTVDMRELAGRIPPAPNLVVITGGEPFRQNITPLVQWLALVRGHTVQIETNGKLPPQQTDGLEALVKYGRIAIVVSPKTTSVHPWFYEYGAAWKYVIRGGDALCEGDVDPEDGLPNTALDHPINNGRLARPPEGAQVFVQPADEQDDALNALNMVAAVNAVREFPQHRRRLSVQMHKLADLE